MRSRTLILASASPRRAELLNRLGLVFSIRPAEIDEIPEAGEDPGDMAERLARAKVVSDTNIPSPALVIAADTVVVIEGCTLGKPRGPDEARRMLRSLAGRTHHVITAIAVLAHPEGTVSTERSISSVTFAPLSDAQIDWYVTTGEGMDKAGAYALQGIGALFVARIEGSYTNVIGLPLDAIYPHLRRWGTLP